MIYRILMSLVLVLVLLAIAEITADDKPRTSAPSTSAPASADDALMKSFRIP